MRYNFILLLLVILSSSCIQNRKANIKKLVYFSVASTCIIDSTLVPHLSIRSYIEYNSNQKLRIAKGKYYSTYDRDVPLNGLYKFFETTTNDSLVLLIEKSLNNESLDSVYDYNWPSEGTWYELIYVINGRLKRIEYYPELLPPSLKNLHLYLEKLTQSNTLTPIDPIRVDSLLIEYETKLFLNHPPPPPAPQREFVIKYINPSNTGK